MILRFRQVPLACRFMSRPSSGNKGWLAQYRELLLTWTRRADSRADAEDAVQDSIASFLANDSAAIGNPRAYLHRSVHNSLADAYRRAQTLDVQSFEVLSEDELPVNGDPDAPVRTAQLLDAMKAALAELPPKCQQVFLWHRLEGYSHQEIAERMGLSVNMVERYMMRAARHLRERLQDFAP